MGMKKKSKVPEAEKKPLADNAATSSIDSDYVTINSTSKSTDNQEASAEQDDLKGRHFAFVVYPESAPADWIDQIKNTGLPFVVSPLHDKDINPDNTPKKAHYHIIVSWGNSTTYRSARALCNILMGPRPKMLRNCTGHYRYLTHRDNPEKYQYSEQPIPYNGWTPPLNAMDVDRIINEIWKAVYVNDCREYGELMILCNELGPEYFAVASRHTMFLKSICDGFRHNPYRVLCRYYNTLPEDSEDKKIISDMIDSVININESEKQERN